MVNGRLTPHQLSTLDYEEDLGERNSDDEPLVPEKIVDDNEAYVTPDYFVVEQIQLPE